MNFKLNETTGKMEAPFTGKLTNISATPQQNVNGTLFYPATVEFTAVDGKRHSISGVVYEGNYKYGLEVGKEYLCRAIHNPEEEDPKRKMFIVVTHLQSIIGERATEDMFGITSEVTSESITPKN